MKNSILGKARWLREVALATSKNNGARVAQEWLKYAAMFVMLLTLGSGNVWGQSTTYTSNVTFTAGTNGSTCKVIVTGSTQYDGMKLGSSNKTGTMTFTVPEGTTTIHIHAAGWNGDGGSRTLNISTSRGKLASGSTSMALTNDAGVSNNSPFTLNTPTEASTSYYKSLSISGVTGGTATITITTSSKRAVVWGVNAVVPTSCTTNPTVTEGSNSSVTATTATVTCSSGISSLGSAGCSISSYGFVMNTTGTPTISDTKYEVDNSYTTTGTLFYKDLTGLSAETTYYVRPYATNGNGTAYGTQTSFTTQAIPKYTVSFNTGSGNPTQDAITEASGGAGIILPAGPTPTCSGDGWSFAGWKETSAVTSETTVAPTLLSAGSTFLPTGNVTLYAVYKKETLSNNYEKITTSAALTSGSNYVVARGTAWGLDANKYTMSSNDGYFGVTAISVSENVISNPDADLIWQISGDNTDGYSLYNSNRNLYIGYSTTYHDLYADGTRHRDYTITFTSSNFYIKSKSESSYHFSTWSYSLQGGGSAYFFEIDNSSAYVVLYKQKGTNTYFSNPTCCVQNTITKTGGGTVIGGTFTTSVASACDGVSVTLTPTADPGYTFSNWTVTKTASPYTDITSSNVDGNTLTMPDYGVTVNATFTPTPTLTATGGDLSETTLSFGTSCEQDEETDKTFVLNGYSLTNNVTLTIGGTDASMFSVKSPSSPINKGTGRINDQTVTVTFTPTSTGAKTATLTIASSGASSIVLTLNGTAIKHYKVHYWNSGTDVHQESVLAGADASATWNGVGDNDGCDTETYKYFVGWSKTNVGSTPTTTKPTIGGTYTSVSADVNYYAVWTNVNPNGWERYESSTIAEGDYLFIQYYGSNYQALNNSISSNRMGANVATLSGGLITQPTQAVSYDWNDYIWHIAKPDPDKEEYTIYNADESKYIVSTGTASEVDFVASPSDGKELFTITYNSTTKKYVWTNKYNSTNSVNAVFRYGGSGFACYASTDHNLYLYYRAGGTAKYITNCCDKNVALSGGSPSNGTITFKDGVNAVTSVATCGGNKTITMEITPAAGYKLTAWSTSSSTVTPTDTDPSVAITGDDSKSEQTITLTFAQGANGNYTGAATFTAMTDYFIDKLHYDVNTAYKDPGVSMSGTYTVPTPSNGGVPSDDSCAELHYKFVGWVPASDVNASTGAVTSTANMITAGTTDHAASDITYYAIWAKEQ